MARAAPARARRRNRQQRPEKSSCGDSHLVRPPVFSLRRLGSEQRTAPRAGRCPAREIPGPSSTAVAIVKKSHAGAGEGWEADGNGNYPVASAPRGGDAPGASRIHVRARRQRLLVAGEGDRRALRREGGNNSRQPHRVRRDSVFRQGARPGAEGRGRLSGRRHLGLATRQTRGASAAAAGAAAGYRTRRGSNRRRRSPAQATRARPAVTSNSGRGATTVEGGSHGPGISRVVVLP